MLRKPKNFVMAVGRTAAAVNHILVEKVSLPFSQGYGFPQSLERYLPGADEDKLKILVPVHGMEPGRMGHAFPFIKIHHKIREFSRSLIHVNRVDILFFFHSAHPVL